MITAVLKFGVVFKAAKEAKVGRRSHYEWLKSDPDYKAAIEDALESRIEMLEAEAFRRAHDGVAKPVYQQGQKVGEIQEFSDTLLIFLLKAARPSVYKDRIANEHSGPNGGPIPYELTPTERDRRLAAILERARRRRDTELAGSGTVAALTGSAD